MRPSSLTAKLSRYFCMKSNSVNGNVAVISDIFCNFTMIFFKIYPRISPWWVHRGFVINLQNIYETDKQLVGYFLNVPIYIYIIPMHFCLHRRQNLRRQRMQPVALERVWDCGSVPAKTREKTNLSIKTAKNKAVNSKKYIFFLKNYVKLMRNVLTNLYFVL